jgi:hypothetical protein
MINGAIYITPAALLLARKITPLPEGVLLFPRLPAHCPPVSLRRLWVDGDDPTPLRCTVKSTWGDAGRVLEPVSMVDFTDFVSIWNLISKQVLGRRPGQARPAGFRKAGRERERVPSISSGTHQYSDSFIYHCPSIIYSSLTIVLINFVIFVAMHVFPG